MIKITCSVCKTEVEYRSITAYQNEIGELQNSFQSFPFLMSQVATKNVTLCSPCWKRCCTELDSELKGTNDILMKKVDNLLGNPPSPLQLVQPGKEGPPLAALT